jgi:hypothetical protein
MGKWVNDISQWVVHSQIGIPQIENYKEFMQHSSKSQMLFMFFLFMMSSEQGNTVIFVPTMKFTHVALSVNSIKRSYNTFQ